MCKCIVLFIGALNNVFHNVYALKCRTEGRFINYKLECTFKGIFTLVCILLGISPESEFCMPTFRNTLSVPSS